MTLSASSPRACRRQALDAVKIVGGGELAQEHNIRVAPIVQQRFFSPSPRVGTILISRAQPVALKVSDVPLQGLAVLRAALLCGVLEAAVF